MKNNVKRRLIISLKLWAVSGLNMFLFSRFSNVFFPVYRSISKKWISLLALISSMLKIAVWDIGLILLIVLFVVMTVRTIKEKKPFMHWLSAVVLTVSVLMAVAVNGWMLNLYAPSLASELSLKVEKYDVDQLYEACEYYLQKAGEYAVLIERDENGEAVKPDFYATAEKAGNSYAVLADQYPVFSGSSKPVKKLSVIGVYLMYNGIDGMFMPITGEAGVPGKVPAVPLGFVMCHEAAHRLGIASEQEANFAAFMACISNDDDYFRYSGYYEAFAYTFNSLYRTDSEKAAQLYENHADEKGVQLLRQDRRYNRDYYRKYESPLQDISDEINDRYLKTFSEESGIQSYGEVTEYLIAYYLQNR